MERTIDLIARDLNLDPAEVRRRNFIPSEACPYETPTGITYDSSNYAPTFDRALELSEYYSWREQARQPSERGNEPLIGVGLAMVVKGSGGRIPRLTDHARVIIEPSGQVIVHTGISPHGQGSETTFAQVVADELGVTPADDRVLHSDTHILPAGGGTSGSRGLVAGGTALYLLLQEARQKLAAIASRLLDCPAEAVAF
jgi:carbon-monoxide dehydrogenase large subunit